MRKDIIDYVKEQALALQEELTDAVEELADSDNEVDGYKANRFQDAADALQDVMDHMRYINDPKAFNTEVIEAHKTWRQINEERIASLEKELRSANTDIESYKMAISRANDTIKEQIGAIKMLKELLREV